MSTRVHAELGTGRVPVRRTDPDGRPAATAPRLTLFAALLGFVMIAMDASAVNVALPAVGRGLGGSTSGLAWIVDAYTLMFAALLLTVGAFSGRVGASRLYAAGAAAFTLASAACGLAASLDFPVAVRLIQGSAAAFMLPSSLALVRQCFPDARARRRRSRSGPWREPRPLPWGRCSTAC